VLLRFLAILMWITASFSAQAEGVRAHALAGIAPAAAECLTPQSGDTVDHCANVCVAGSEFALAGGPVLQPLPPDQPDAPPAVIPAVVDAMSPVEAVKPGETVALTVPSAHLRDLSGVRLLV